MKACVVRVIHNRTIVGFFCADNIVDLHYWVDSVADPGVCEYRAIESGGIAWEGESAVPFANGESREDDDEEERCAMAGTSLTESWSDVLFDSDAEWQSMGPMRYGPAAARSGDA